MKRHVLKTSEPWFSRVMAGDKTAEIRKHDRDFQVGDELILFNGWRLNDGDEYISARVTHVLPAAQFPEGLQPGYALLSMTAIIASTWQEPTE